MLIQAVMLTNVATKTGASFGERSWERINSRNAYRASLGPPEEARTPRKNRGIRDHSVPSQSSKTVLSTVHVGGHQWMVGETIFEMWPGAL